MKNIIYILACCLTGVFCDAQNYNNDKVASVIEEKLLFIDYTTTAINSVASRENLVFINQHGKNNLSKITVKANESNVEVQQIGNDNLVDIDVIAGKVDEKIIQIGDNNIFEDYNHLNIYSTFCGKGIIKTQTICNGKYFPSNIVTISHKSKLNKNTNNL